MNSIIAPIPLGNTSVQRDDVLFGHLRAFFLQLRPDFSPQTFEHLFHTFNFAVERTSERSVRIRMQIPGFSDSKLPWLDETVGGCHGDELVVSDSIRLSIISADSTSVIIELKGEPK